MLALRCGQLSHPPACFRGWQQFDRRRKPLCFICDADKPVWLPVEILDSVGQKVDVFRQIVTETSAPKEADKADHLRHTLMTCCPAGKS